MLRLLLLFATALASAAACLPASAHPPVELSLVDRGTGQRLPAYPYRGQAYVPGTPGHRYAVRLRNQTGERVLVVLSVDGVNAVTGQTASPSQAGYVLAPWESTEIAGWRKSFDQIAQFHFTDLGDSYAARTGRPDNVGVVGIAVFRERHDTPAYPLPYPSPPIARPRHNAARGADARNAHRGQQAQASAERAASSANATADMAGQQLGTGHGAREWAPVGRTDFARATRRPTQVTELRYDSIDVLIARGIVPRERTRQRWHAGPPRAFPSGFVADPPGW